MEGPITEVAYAIFVAARGSAPIGVSQNIYLSIYLLIPAIILHSNPNPKHNPNPCFARFTLLIPSSYIE